MVRDRVFITMVSVSMLFHLSMVTLFSIYVYVPVSRPKYAQLDIEYLEPGRIDLAASDLTLRIPAMGGALTPETGSGVPDPPEEGPLAATERLTLQLPEIAPPAFDSAQLERSEMIASVTRALPLRLPDLEEDSWARSIGRIERIQDRLREYTSLDSVFPVAPNPHHFVPITQPIADIRMYIEWGREPLDRKLELRPPIDSLWRLDPKALEKPLGLAFKVNAAGEVVYVLPTDDEVLRDVADALKQFRFAPLDDPRSDDQIGTLVIAPEGNS